MAVKVLITIMYLWSFNDADLLINRFYLFINEFPAYPQYNIHFTLIPVVPAGYDAKGIRFSYKSRSAIRPGMGDN